MRAFDLRESFRFFLTHAGYIVGQRAMCAIRAARDERDLKAGIEAGTLRVRWVYDDDVDTSYLDSWPKAERERVEHYGCIVERLETWRNVETGAERRTWEEVGSLWGIGMLPESEDDDRRMYEAQVYGDSV